MHDSMDANTALQSQICYHDMIALLPTVCYHDCVILMPLIVIMLFIFNMIRYQDNYIAMRRKVFPFRFLKISIFKKESFVRWNKNQKRSLVNICTRRWRNTTIMLLLNTGREPYSSIPLQIGGILCIWKIENKVIFLFKYSLDGNNHIFRCFVHNMPSISL
jgi:hypothetical protein